MFIIPIMSRGTWLVDACQSCFRLYIARCSGAWMIILSCELFTIRMHLFCFACTAHTRRIFKIVCLCKPLVTVLHLYYVCIADRLPKITTFTIMLVYSVNHRESRLPTAMYLKKIF